MSSSAQNTPNPVSNKTIFGVLRLLPLPGSSLWSGDMDKVIARAEQEALALVSGGVTAILIENTGNEPYTSQSLHPSGLLAMAHIYEHLKTLCHVPFGVTVYPNDVESAVSLASQLNADWIRIPVLTGARITNEGIVEGCLHGLLEAEKSLAIGSNSVTRPYKLLIDVSRHHLMVEAQGAPVTDESLMKKLMSIETAYGKCLPIDGYILNDTVHPEAITALTTTNSEATESPLLNRIFCSSTEHSEDTHTEWLKWMSQSYQVSHGLVLDLGVRKTINNAVTSNTPTTLALEGSLPSVDMIKIEEIVRKATGIKGIEDHDPEYFLSRTVPKAPNAQ